MPSNDRNFASISDGLNVEANAWDSLSDSGEDHARDKDLPLPRLMAAAAEVPAKQDARVQPSGDELGAVAGLSKKTGAFISGIIYVSLFTIIMILAFAVASLSNTTSSKVCAALSPATPLVSSFQAAFHCIPLAAPLDLKDPAFLNLRSATESSLAAFGGFSAGLEVPSSVHECYVPECKDMGRSLSLVNTEMESTGITLLDITLETRMLVEGLVYDAHSSADALGHAFSFASEDTSLVPHTRIAIAHHSAGRSSSLRQNISTLEDPLRDVRRTLFSLRQTICTPPETEIVFEPSSFLDNLLWGSRWKAEVVNRATGQRRPLEYGKADIELLRQASADYSAALQGACKQVLSVDSETITLWRALFLLRLVVEEHAQPSSASLVSRLDPRIQMNVYRAGLSEVAQLEEHELVVPQNDTIDVIPGGVELNATGSKTRGDTEEGLLHTCVNFLGWLLPQGARVGAPAGR